MNLMIRNFRRASAPCDARAVVARSQAACGQAREAPHVGVGVREPPVLQSGREVRS
jgi:hypothetical protein